MLATKTTATETNVATTFYINPESGNDGNTGLGGSPWKTLAHAFNNVSDGDTIILQNGTYIGEGQSYVTLKGKSNITIRAENEHGAILDGSWGHELVGGNFYENIDVAYWDHQPAWLPRKGRTAAYNSLLTLDGCENATIDGLRIQNSIGIGISVRESVLSLSTIVEGYLGKKLPFSMREVWQASDVPLENNSLQGLLGLIYISASETYKRPDDYPITTVRNCILDWCHFGAFKVFYGTNRSLIEGNTMTRCAFDWWINRTPEGQAMPTETPEGDPIPGNVGQYFAAQRKGTRPGPMWKVTWDKKKKEWVADGNWSAVILWGNNTIIRNNVIAFSFGEVSPYKNSSHALVESNKFIGNSNNCYLNSQRGATVRNNLLVSIPGEYSESEYIYRKGGKTFVTANEAYSWNYHLNDDLQVYNNLMLFGQVAFRPHQNNDRDISRFYFGHNTIVAGPVTEPKTDSVLAIYAGPAKLSGIVENNIWDTSLNRRAEWIPNSETVTDGLDQLAIRYNVFPTGAPVFLKNSTNAKVTDVVQIGRGNPGDSDTWLVDLANAITPPLTALTFDEMQKHLKDVQDALNAHVHRFRPRAGVVAENNAYIGSDVLYDTTQPPEVAKDYFGDSRGDLHDIGACEGQ